MHNSISPVRVASMHLATWTRSSAGPSGFVLLIHLPLVRCIGCGAGPAGRSAEKAVARHAPLGATLLSAILYLSIIFCTFASSAGDMPCTTAMPAMVGSCPKRGELTGLACLGRKMYTRPRPRGMQRACDRGHASHIAAICWHNGAQHATSVHADVSRAMHGAERNARRRRETHWQ